MSQKPPKPFATRLETRPDDIIDPSAPASPLVVPRYDIFADARKFWANESARADREGETPLRTISELVFDELQLIIRARKVVNRMAGGELAPDQTLINSWWTTATTVMAFSGMMRGIVNATHLRLRPGFPHEAEGLIDFGREEPDKIGLHVTHAVAENELGLEPLSPDESAWYRGEYGVYLQISTPADPTERMRDIFTEGGGFPAQQFVSVIPRMQAAAWNNSVRFE